MQHWHNVLRTAGDELWRLWAPSGRVNGAAATKAATDVTIPRMRAFIAGSSVTESPRGMAAMNLSLLLGARWAGTRSEEGWADAVAELEDIRDLVSPETKMLPLYDLAIGQLWYKRAGATEDLDDQAAAINALEVARGQVLEGSGVYCTASTYLGEVRLRFSSRSGDPVALEQAVQDFMAVLHETRARGVEKARSAVGLSAALWLRYQRGRDPDDLRVALFTALTALKDPDMTFKNLSLVHGLLGSLYGETHDVCDELKDLDASIAHWEQRLSMTTDDPVEEAIAHDNAGNAYSRRYAVRHDQADLGRAIHESRAALELAPAGTPVRGRIWTNLSRSLLEQGLIHQQERVLDDAVAAARAGLDDNFDAPNVRPRLRKQLACAILIRQAMFGASEDLETVVVEAISLLEGALAAFLVANATLPVKQRLTSRSMANGVQSLLVGLHLTRSRATSDLSANQGMGQDAKPGRYLSLAFAAAEASKAPLLTREVLRLQLSPPKELREGSSRWEALLLAEAAALDLYELLDDTEDFALRMRRMRRRQLVQTALEEEWDAMALSDSEAVRRHALRRRNDITGLAEALRARPAGCDLVSLVVPTYIDATGHQAKRMSFMVLREGAQHPVVLCEVDQDVMGRIITTMPAWAREETSVAPETQAAIVPLVQALSIGAGSSSRCLVLSPTTDTFALPWQMLFSRAGWTARDGGPLPVLIVPSHALTVTPLEGSDYVRTEDINVVRRLGIEDFDDLAPYLRFSTSGERRPSTGAAVFGNPTGDLPSAAEEAAEIATLLRTEAVLGSDATQAAVLRAVERADLIHIAAHVSVDAGHPLQSELALADGQLTGADLLSRLGAAHLVVLSACHSGYGESLGGGELAGFTTALLRAGIHSVVSSSWPVDDAASSFFMTTFHELRLRGRSTAAALAEAAAAVASEPGWEAPYYWAAFTLTQRSYA